MEIAAPGPGTYSFTVAETGDYTIEAKVIAPSTSSNSFSMSVDGESTWPWHILPLAPTEEWRALATPSATAGQPEATARVFAFTAGAHILRIIQREVGTQISAFRLVRVASPLTPRQRAEAKLVELGLTAEEASSL